MKDLVDIVFYASTERFELAQLALAVRAECGKREMDVPKEFKAPGEWRARFKTFATKNHVPTSFRDFDAASELVSRFFGPALGESRVRMIWDPRVLAWSPDERAR